MPSDNVYGVLRNADSAALTRGMVVRMSTTNSIVRALADSTADLQGLVGVLNSGIVGIGGNASNIVSSSLRQQVLLETGLTPAAGQTLYISSTVAGRATNVAPATYPVPIGIIGDVSAYSRNSTVVAAVVMPGLTAADFAKLATVPAGVGITDAAFTQVIDLTATGTYTIIPPTPARLGLVLDLAWEIKSVNACSVSPTYSVGSNSPNFNNKNVSQTAAGFTTQAAETRVANTSSVAPVPVLDLSTDGLKVNVTGGATATALTARYGIAFYLLPL